VTQGPAVFGRLARGYEFTGEGVDQ
jgi:hypothetical protein